MATATTPLDGNWSAPSKHANTPSPRNPNTYPPCCSTAAASSRMTATLTLMNLFRRVPKRSCSESTQVQEHGDGVRTAGRSEWKISEPRMSERCSARGGRLQALRAGYRENLPSPTPIEVLDAPHHRRSELITIASHVPLPTFELSLRTQRNARVVGPERHTPHDSAPPRGR